MSWRVVVISSTAKLDYKMERDELEMFYKRLEYEKLNVLLLESHQTNEFLDCENVLIIDKDLCEIR